MPNTPSGRRRRRVFVAVAIAVLAVGVAAAVILLHQPGNVSHPNLSFTRPSPPSRKPALVDTFEWPRYGFDAGRTRSFTSGHNLHPPFRTGWVYEDHALLEFPPVIYGRTLYVLDDEGSAKGIDKVTGRKLWERKVGTLAAASPAIDLRDHSVIVTLLSTNRGAGQNPGNGRIAALSMRDGRVLWSRVVPPGTESSPMVFGPSVYFGDQNGTVYSLRARDGRVQWTYHASAAVKGGPSLAGGVVFFGDYAGRAYGLDAATGRQVWATSTDGTHFGFGSGNFYSSPAVAFGRVYMGNTDGRVYSFAARTGELAWATGTGAYVYSSAAVADVPGLGPTVYLGSYDGTFYAFDARSGTVRWTHHAGGKISGSPTIVDGIVYFSDLGDRNTQGLDARSGRQVFSLPDGAFNPVIADPGTIYMVGYSKIYQMLPASRPGPGGPHAAPRPHKGRH